ncbi:hypothetical protein LINPERPRIM_LOCUS26278 [Linum perenne]
MLGILAH